VAKCVDQDDFFEVPIDQQEAKVLADLNVVVTQRLESWNKYLRMVDDAYTDKKS
jgi:hypothetical protein